MNAKRETLLIGQSFLQHDGAASQPVTIARLDRDRFGAPRVTFVAPDGHEITAYAAQVETAIADGYLAPLALVSDRACA